jgi:hypothetical protein
MASEGGHMYGEKTAVKPMGTNLVVAKLNVSHLSSSDLLSERIGQRRPYMKVTCASCHLRPASYQKLYNFCPSTGASHMQWRPV